MPKVLVVDDDTTILSAVAEGLPLAAPGFEVKTASSGQEAREVLDADPDIDAIVCDARMPGLHGLDVLTWAKEKGHKAKRILLTGYNPAMIQQRDLDKASPVTLLVKPVNLGQLARFSVPGYQMPADGATKSH